MFNYLRIKRIIDFTVSLLALLLCGPILIGIGIFLFFFNNGNVFFTQMRPGKNEKIFRLLKFKTMNDKKDSFGNLLPDDKRITSIGNFLRKTSLDELPQIFNVLFGNMSLIGPRPLLISYLPLYNENQRKRHILSPGITGWAQVNGRNKVNWTDKFEMDIWYTEHVSASLDLKIIALTMIKVITGNGVSGFSSATMEPFLGNLQNQSTLNEFSSHS